MDKSQLRDMGIRAANIAMEEWRYFGSQFVDGEDSSLPIKCTSSNHGTLGSGDSPGYQERVWSYFRHGVFDGDRSIEVSGQSENGEEEWLNYKSWAWSGAFISYCFRQAGAGSYFPYSPAHHKYMMAGVINRLNGTAGPITCDIDERQPQIGDLVWKGRLESRGWSYSKLRDHAKIDAGSFRPHCDLVVDINQNNNELFLIGGNVRNSVLRLKLELDEKGMIKSNVYSAMLCLNCVDDLS